MKMMTAGCSEILNPICWDMWLTFEKAINILVFICYITFFYSALSSHLLTNYMDHIFFRESNILKDTEEISCTL